MRGSLDISRASDFFALSREIAEEFLQSTIIVDDLAGLGPYSEVVAGHTTAVPPPGRRVSSASEENPEGSERPAEFAHVPDIETQAHFLNAKTVIDSFARKGIVCSVLKPEKKEMDRLAGLLSGRAGCADILVLDWQLDRDNGQWALAILSSILQRETGRYSGRLRLFAVYTGLQNVQRIAGTVKVTLEAETGIRFEQDGDLALGWPGGRIVVLAKQGTGVPDHYRANEVPFEDLAERLTVEFTTLTAGLVSNVVVEALARVRNNASRILRNFSDGLDAPYLSHRFMLAEPTNAEAFLTALVAEELLGILEGADVGSKAGIAAIQAWLAAKKFTGFSLRDGEKKLEFSVEHVLSVLRHGLKNQTGIDISKSKLDELDKDIHRKDLTRFFEGNSGGTELDERFSHITMMRACYDKTRPTLTLGTVVQDADDADKFYVCVQPRCDSVRLDGPRCFPFLPLKLVQRESNEPFDTLVRDGAGYRRLRGSRKPRDLRLIRFQPGANSHGVIQALEDGECYYFEDASEPKKKYRWMGELRREQALRLSDDFAAVFGRVGLDEYEWLRRWAGKRG
ncbi:MAG: response regulator receiver domain [Acidobacteria bacterium]|nr:response regulator receiver domain [Acidobacteriota bacterium]